MAEMRGEYHAGTRKNQHTSIDGSCDCLYDGHLLFAGTVSIGAGSETERLDRSHYRYCYRFGVDCYVCCFGKSVSRHDLGPIQRENFGKMAGKIDLLVVFLIFHFSFGTDARDLGNFIVSNVMPETPVEVILISFSMVVVIATRYGLEVIARTTEIFFPWIFVSLLFLTFTLLPEIEINQLEPVTEGGIKPLLGAGIQFSSLQEFVCFLMLLPFVNRPKKVLHSLLLGAAAGGVILIIITALCILVLGSDFTARNIYPSFVLAKKISIGNFLERVEVLLAGVWFLSIFIKTTITFYVSALGLAQSLELRTYKPLTVPLGVLMVALSVLAYPNITKLLEFVPKIWFSYAYTFLLLLPLLLLLVALIRGKSEAPLSMEQKD
ncbi:GerAB/ArcD/ProY family transporter [Brevibacillus borstelensis]|uniref:GerAB/ArcD/ProY family transporter n=1 Tax=Brevibacillus borstelensis TaxID=45462 RepID=UPI003872D5F3